MKRSTQRVLTTHTGSLPRPADVVELLLHEQEHPGTEAAKLKDAVRRAVSEVVTKQVGCGLDIINDGEASKIGYATYVRERLSGFEGTSRSLTIWDLDEVPEFKGRNTTTEFLTKYIFERLAKNARADELGRDGREPVQPGMRGPGNGIEFVDQFGLPHRS